MIRLAEEHERAGDLTRARACLREFVSENTNHHGAWHALGLLAHRDGDLVNAVSCLESAVAIDSASAMYVRNLGEMYRRQGEVVKAIAAGNRACILAPRDVNAHYNLAVAHVDAGEYHRAIDHYRRALLIDAKHDMSWNNLGSALEKIGDKPRAQAAYESAIAANPLHAEARNNLGAIYLEQGRLVDARTCFEAAVDARSDFIEAHYNLSLLKTFGDDDRHIEQLRQLYEQREALPVALRVRLCFAWGKALDDLGQYDRAFDAFETGNSLQHRSLPVDEARAEHDLVTSMGGFDEKFFAARRGWSGVRDDKRTPVFIIGMPRSGTTLLEQVLSSHPQLHGEGEVSALHDAIAAVAGGERQSPSLVHRITALTQEDLRRIGERYLATVWKAAPESRFISDKMPANFFYLGLIHLVFPGARIIHVRRDPMATCVSCYLRLFNDSSMAFSYDQATLGRYYVRYRRLMQHWRDVLPHDAFLDVAYEELVSSTETQVRRVLEFVGLPWDAQCLQFHTNDRVVKTASNAQVRQPIYTESVARWRHYDHRLQSLQQILNNLEGRSPTEAVVRRSAEAYHVEGVELYRQGKLPEALLCYERSIELRPENAIVLNSRGFVLQDMNRLDEARACFDRAVELDPQFAMARLNLGLLQLKLGEWEAGWENYEARWTGSAEAGHGKFERIACPLPHWESRADTAGQRLLVITEQGFGDCFQFARYLSLARERFAKVGLLCSAPTQRLIEWTWGESITTLTHVPADFSGWDLQCSLLSLPRLFGTRPDTIPANVPYLRVTPAALDYWRTRSQAAAPDRLRVGIAWAGRRSHQNDARRSLRFEQLRPLFDDRRIAWFSLQKWSPEDARPQVPHDLHWTDWTDELDFADTAALIANLDLVVSVDSVMVHLTGALGRPVWMLNRFDSEWRWFHRRTDSPWYPSLRIFNQPVFGDWAGVLDDVAHALQAMDAPPASSAAPRGRTDKASPAKGTPFAPLPEHPLQHVAQLQSAGRLKEAEDLAARVLQASPHDAHAVHLLGVIAWSAGEQQKATRLIEQAIALDPSTALFHSNLAEMLRQLRQPDAAIRYGLQATQLDPALATAHANLGIAYYDSKNYEQAAACQQRALQLAPHLVISLNNLGSIARACKDLTTAIAWYRKALAVDPDFVEALSNLSATLIEQEEIEAAETYVLRALQIQPRCAEALCNLGLVRFRQDRIDEAQTLLERALQLRSGYAEALMGLGMVMLERQRLPDAVAFLEQSLDSQPERVGAWCVLASVYMESADLALAEAAYERALAIDPDSSEAFNGLGNLRLEEGRMADAQRLLERAIVVDPTNLAARFHLTQARKVTADDPNLAALQELLPNAADMPDGRCISLHYALGKSYDDLQEWDRAFPHFLEGARLKRAKIQYEADLDAARVQRVISLTGASALQRLRGAGDSSELPIFVLGMPRSGTTLTEQIVASHRDVHGAGEVRDLMQTLHQQFPASEPPFPENLALLTKKNMSAWGAAYVSRLRARAPEARRITDKMPANYILLGIIPLVLPNARIIHVKRSPVDTCVSCFTRLFNRHQEATYDLLELGRHYANYARLMQHWRAVMPAGSFIEVQYEDIVDDVEAQARRLVEWLGLPWDEACLDFHKTQRPVRTASVTQVRQPIYRHSLARWKHYERYLEPLIEGLAEFAPTRD
ncbi:MAG: sulfotransferase [Steroidobacteraceae bacterium]